MIEFFHTLFGTDFMPHVFCLRDPGLVWLHALSDGLIALAYLLIPFGLLQLVRKRRDLSFHWLVLLFAVFILSCGATHVLGIVTLWLPVYRLDGLVKLITALASLATAWFLLRMIPTIATLPSPAQWRQSNDELKKEIEQRKSAELGILALNEELEKRVENRTRALEENNAKLLELTAAWDLSHGLIREPSGGITFWCEGSEQLYGWTKREAIGRSSHSLLQTQFPIPLAEINQELEEKGSWAGELVHCTKAGLWLKVAAHWILQRNSVSDVTSVIEINNDITDRLRAEEATQRLADLVESSNDAILGSTLDGTITSWNSSAEKLFGYTAAEILGQAIDRLTPAALQEERRALVKQANGDVSAKRFETVCETKSGREVAVALALSPIRDSSGAVIGTSQILHDISETKALAEASRLNEERYRLAVEAGQVGLWYLNAADGSVMWTARCKELHGLLPEDPVPEYPEPFLLVHAEDRQELESAFRQTLEGKADFSLVYRTRGLDFKPKWIHSQGQALRDSSGIVIGVHGTVIDLTARKEMEDKLRRANTELEQFAYAAAHDLQEPLRNVALAAALLNLEYAAPQLTEPANADPPLLNTIVENARRMEAMVKDLLAYSRALDVADQVNCHADGNLVLERALQNLHSAIAEQQAEITNDRLPLLCMDETHLLQILQNLIGNALKYNGVVLPRIHIGAHERPGDVLIFVRDNGVGIAPQFHERAFGMFKRLHDGSVKGTGIGLAVCKRIVEHYAGKIWIESQAGCGATFCFTIPSNDSH